MQTSSSFIVDALKEGEALFPAARVIAEWNHNRYTTVTTIDNFGFPEATNGYDLDMYPIESIVDPVRPTAGLLKGRMGEGAVSQGYSDTVSGYRTYTAGPDSKYKYWTGPTKSNAVAFPGGGFTLPDPVKPYIIYANAVLTNKIYICTENSWARPQKWNIQITTDGTTWTTVASDLTPNSAGQVVLYLQNDTSWTSTVNRANGMYIKGIRLLVNSMNLSNSWFNLIELGARLEKDLSDRLIDYSVKNELSDPDFITPMGTISSNTGSVSLSNFDGIFNNDNEDSPYEGLIDANVKFTIDFAIDVSSWGGSGLEYIRQCTMYSESWSGGDDQVDIPLKDASKFLQEIKPGAQLMQNVTIGMAIWRILDSIGFIDYQYVRAAEVASNQIPYYWTDDEKTVWDNIQDLCRVTQSAAYFDEHGILQIKSRDSAFDKNRPVDWTFDYAQDGDKLPDIVDLSVGNTFEANKVTVKYQKTNLAQDAQGRPISEIVWQPEDDIVLRSSALAADMGISDTFFWIDKAHAPVWPFDGIVNIRGELIKYKGKGYRYYPSGRAYTGNINTDTEFKIIYSTDEKLQIDNELSSATQGWRNYFTGYMKVEERGWDDTTAKAHDTTIQVYRDNGGWWGQIGGTQRKWNGGLQHFPQASLLRLQTTASFKNGNYWYTVRRTSPGNETMKFFGTRMRFPSTPKGPQQLAGIWMWGNSAQNTMYGIDVVSTAKVNRTVGNEIRILRRTGGAVTQIGGKGAAFAIADNQWIDLDVVMTGGDFTVSVNGSVVLRATDPSPLTETGAAGLYARGNTVVDFEYFYMMGDKGIQETDLDNSSYLDIINGGYYSNQYYKDNAYKVRTVKRRRGKKTVTYKQWYDRRFFDEFGMEVHEVRPYEITFDKKPVLYSTLYVSNSDQVVTDEYIHNPFGSHFIIANAARVNAIVNGEDTLTYGSENPVQQRIMITGRTIQQAEATDYVVKNEQAIRARGEISIEFESPWIQSEAAAKAIGDWIVNNWSEPADEVEMEIFGNPLIQIGDNVAINYPPKDMVDTTHRYFVISVDQNWENGLVTSLSLRRNKSII